MNKTICDAIDVRIVVDLRYSGYSRTVEPHAYGRDRSGDEVLRCYQVSGGSESGERAGWKLLKVRDVFSLHHTSMSFNPRPDYKRDDKAMDYIFRQI